MIPFILARNSLTWIFERAAKPKNNKLVPVFLSCCDNWLIYVYGWIRDSTRECVRHQKPLIESDYQSCRNLAPDRKRERLKKAWELNYCLSGRINRRKKCQRWFGWHACSLCQLSHLHSFFLWFRGWKTFYGNFVFNWLKWATILFYCKYTKSDWPPYCMGSLNRKC